MHRISFKAVGLAFLLMLFLDIAFGLTALVLYGGDVLAPGQSEQQMSLALDAVSRSPGFLLLSMLLGLLTTLLGGYLAARIAQRFPYLNGLALGVLATLLGLGFWAQYPLWFNLAALASAVPASLLGAHVAARTSELALSKARHPNLGPEPPKMPR